MIGAAAETAKDSVAFFQVLAGVSATLLALSFVALGFFLEGLFQRHRALTLPLIREEDEKHLARRFGRELTPKLWHVPDRRLFDGDPLVVFIAFSVAVTWNLYFISLLTSVTASVPRFSNPIVYAVELVIFCTTLALDLWYRHKQYMRLATYRTRDELLWLPYSVLLAVIYLLLALFAVSAAIPATAHLWTRAGIDSEEWLVTLLKGACPFALFSALYFTNHDYFVFFKARISDEVRQRWLSQFVSKDDGYKRLQVAVSDAARDAQGVPEKASALEHLQKEWNQGYPPSTCFRVALDIFSPGASPLSKVTTTLKACARVKQDPRDPPCFTPKHIWDELQTKGRTVAAWMLDVPGISDWADKIGELAAAVNAAGPSSSPAPQAPSRPPERQ